MKYKYNGQWYDVTIKALDSMPVGSIVDYDGQASNIPSGWEEESGNPNIYSTAETDTGKTWIDGKKIYRKCFTGTGTSTGGDGSTEEISSGITNIEDIVRLYGTYSDSDGIITEQLGGYLNNLDNASFLYFDSSSAKIKFSRGGSWKYGKYNIVIEYTKSS